MATCDPKPAANLSTLSARQDPPLERLRSSNSVSIVSTLATGGTRWSNRMRGATASSKPTPIGCPVNPFVLATRMPGSPSPKASRRALTSAVALPPRAGV
jgi:hypothetical protein